MFQNPARASPSERLMCSLDILQLLALQCPSASSVRSLAMASSRWARAVRSVTFQLKHRFATHVAGHKRVTCVDIDWRGRRLPNGDLFDLEVAVNWHRVGGPASEELYIRGTAGPSGIGWECYEVNAWQYINSSVAAKMRNVVARGCYSGLEEILCVPWDPLVQQHSQETGVQLCSGGAVVTDADAFMHGIVAVVQHVYNPNYPDGGLSGFPPKYATRED